MAVAWIATMPPPRRLALALGVVVAAGVPVALAYWIFGSDVASSVYRGMTFMLVAIARLPLRRQAVIAAMVGLAAFTGDRVSDSMPWLMVTVIIACLLQVRFNTWSIGAGALLPPAVVSYSNAPTERPLTVAAASVLGAAIAIAAGRLMGSTGRQLAVPTQVAIRHAVTLAAACGGLILINEAVGLPHGSWDILTLCLVYLPDAQQTREKIRQRVTGTIIGAIVAAAIASQAPRIVCLILAIPCALLAVAFALGSDDYLNFVIFMTPTIILLYGSSKRGWDVVGLAGERVGLTIVAGLIAIGLTALITRRRRTRPG